MEAIPLDACMHCLDGQTPHQEWHGTRADYLSIGEEMSRRQKARDVWEIKAMPDDQLVGFGQRMRRVLANAETDGVPDFLVDLCRDWVEVAKKEWAWRRRAAQNGAGPVSRSGGSWPERIERVKQFSDLALLIAHENHGAEPVFGGKWKCCCPFHNDRSPSLDIDPLKGVWICRACNVGGDAITYVQLRYGLDFVEAVAQLEQQFGIRPPERVIHGVPVVRVNGAR